jgi:hypothetical protein
MFHMTYEHRVLLLRVWVLRFSRWDDEKRVTNHCFLSELNLQSADFFGRVLTTTPKQPWLTTMVHPLDWISDMIAVLTKMTNEFVKNFDFFNVIESMFHEFRAASIRSVQLENGTSFNQLDFVMHNGRSSKFRYYFKHCKCLQAIVIHW